MTQLSERAKAIIIEIEMGEEDARKKEKEKEAESAKKEKELNEEKEAKKKEEEKEFGEKFGKYFGEHSKNMNDRMCALEESMKSVVAMSEKMMASKKEGE